MPKTKLTPAQRKARNSALTAKAAFYLGAAGSLAANVYASQHTIVGVLTGLWSPMALILALEIVERFPARGRVGRARTIAMVFLALCAAWTSYWHLTHVFGEAGLDQVSVYAMPLTVDVLMGFGRAAMNHKEAPPRPSARRVPAAKPTKLRSVKVS